MAGGLQSSSDRIIARMPIGVTTLVLVAVSVGIVNLVASGNAVIAWDVFAAGIGAVTMIAWFIDTKWFAVSIPALAGLVALYAAGSALAADVPGVLGYTFLSIGCALLVCVVHALQRSRVAWSFLCALCSVFPITLLFGAPKIAHITGLSLPAAMIPGGVIAGAVAALAMQREDFINPPPVPPVTPESHAHGRFVAGFGLAVLVAGILLTMQDDVQLVHVAAFVVAAGVLVLSRGFVRLARPVTTA